MAGGRPRSAPARFNGWKVPTVLAELAKGRRRPKIPALREARVSWIIAGPSLTLSERTRNVVNLGFMSTTVADRPTLALPPGALLVTIRAVAAALAVLAAGLAIQLWRHDALLGGRVARAAIPHGERAWRWPHSVANGVSLGGGTVVAPVLLLTLAALLSIRDRRWRPLLDAGTATLLVGLCVALGKGLAGASAMSGPACTSVVCWGAAAWLLRQRTPTRLRHALHWLAASAAFTVGVAQLYLGHPLPALLTSWLGGAVVLTVLALAHRARSRLGFET